MWVYNVVDGVVVVCGRIAIAIVWQTIMTTQTVRRTWKTEKLGNFINKVHKVNELRASNS